MSEETRPRGSASHKPECACPICKRRKAKLAVISNAAEVAQRVAAITAFTGEVPATATTYGQATTEQAAAPSPGPGPVVGGFKDAEDRKSDYFLYTLDPKEAAIWEHDETLSPLHVPQAIKEKYPQFEWHFVSKIKLDTKGRGYNGWELFHDSSLGYPEGLKRGNDLFLAAMPREMAESYRRRVSERSTEALINMQQGQVAKMDEALGQLRGQGVEAELLEELGGKKVLGGVQVGTRPRFQSTRYPGAQPGGGYNRGLSREQVHEIQAKAIEQRKKNKVYVFQGR